ncbi:MAG: hypothetical protein ABSA58_19425 [Acetobacteraceae bacterium]|jgi:hypothetical protein
MSFFDLSLDTANKFYSWGWRLSIVGAGITALGVLVLMWGTRIKDQDFEEQVAILHSRAATSEERAAGLEKEAAELRLGLAGSKSDRTEDRSPPGTRQITPEQRGCLLGRLGEFKSPVILRFEPDQESGEYAAALRDVFGKAGVPVTFGSALKSTFTGMRLAMAEAPGSNDQPQGAVQMSSILHYCGIPTEPPIPWQQFPRSAGASSVPATRPEEVLIFVGAKPPDR